MILRSYRVTTFEKSPGNWREYAVGDNMIYSYRSTEYDYATFPESLHFHDYYEVVVFVKGNIRYICEGDSLVPEYGDVIIIPPARLHTSMITTGSTEYTRHVFYLFPSAFDGIGGAPLLAFLQNSRSGRFYISLKPNRRQEMLNLLDRIESALAAEAPDYHALAVGYVLQLFFLLNRPANHDERQDQYFPPSIIEIKQYMDEHFTEIESISQVADHFFYSREYISRLFKRYFNTTIHDYLLQRRVSYCQQLMDGNLPMGDIGLKAGFGSPCSFIRAFRAITGMAPSEYRKHYASSR